MKTKKLLAILLAGFMGMAAFTGCGGSTETSGNGETAQEESKDAPKAEKHVFKLSNVFTQDQPLNITLQEVADKVKERTNGEIEIQIYPNGEIAAYKDGVEQVVRGSHFISNDDPSYMGDYVPDYSALIGPMLYDTQEEYSAMCQSDFVKELNKKAEEAGIKVLALDYTFGHRSLVSNTEIVEPEDMEGMKWRVPKSQLWIETLTAMGVPPITTAWSELYSAVQQGVVDGFETSISDVAANQMQDIAKNISLTKHFLGTTNIILSNEVWKTLTPEQQKIMEEEFAAGAIRNNERVKELEAKDRATLEAAGVKINEVNTDAFREKTKVVFDKLPNLTPGVYDRIQEELAKIRANQ